VNLVPPEHPPSSAPRPRFALVPVATLVLLLVGAPAAFALTARAATPATARSPGGEGSLGWSYARRGEQGRQELTLRWEARRWQGGLRYRAGQGRGFFEFVPRPGLWLGCGELGLQWGVGALLGEPQPFAPLDRRVPRRGDAWMRARGTTAWRDSRAPALAVRSTAAPLQWSAWARAGEVGFACAGRSAGLALACRLGSPRGRAWLASLVWGRRTPTLDLRLEVAGPLAGRSAAGLPRAPWELAGAWHWDAAPALGRLSGGFCLPLAADVMPLARPTAGWFVRWDRLHWGRATLALSAAWRLDPAVARAMAATARRLGLRVGLRVAHRARLEGQLHVRRVRQGVRDAGGSGRPGHVQATVTGGGCWIEVGGPRWRGRLTCRRHTDVHAYAWGAGTARWTASDEPATACQATEAATPAGEVRLSLRHRARPFEAGLACAWLLPGSIALPAATRAPGGRTYWRRLPAGGRDCVAYVALRDRRWRCDLIVTATAAEGGLDVGVAAGCALSLGG